MTIRLGRSFQPNAAVKAVRRAAFCLLAVGAASCGASDTPATAPTPTPTQSTVTINGSTVNVSIAATVAARDTGLMRVTNLGASSGMLFVFADDRQRAFWMKDTPTPLSIAFLDANKKVVFLEDMSPNTLTLHGGLNAPQMRYALEVNLGWFASHGITVGMYATFTLPTGLVVQPDP
ncbi:MAG: DUF192 domain-containing protein [Gemmatimonadetes bacterium]|nr:DUF192 domain-containing protein [Gemmatimonadota bacterium]